MVLATHKGRRANADHVEKMIRQKFSSPRKGKDR